VLIWFALIIYGIAPVTVLFLKRQKREEGLIWLVLLACGLLGSILLYLSPITSTRSDSPVLWFSSGSMILSIDGYWNNPEWVIAQCISIYLLVFLSRQYHEREKLSLPLEKIIFVFCCVIFGLLTLSLHKEFALTTILFCLDIFRLVIRVIRNKELFSSQRDTLSLLLRLVSIVLMVYLAARVDPEGYEAGLFSIFPLVVTVIASRIAADFIDQISADQFTGENLHGWLMFLDFVTMVSLLILLPEQTGNTAGILLYSLVFFGMLLLLLTYLWIFRSRSHENRIWIFFFAMSLTLFFFLLGIRQELLFLMLPICFLMINSPLHDGKRGIEIVLLICEGIFLLGFTFSPFYLLNKNLLNVPNLLPFKYFALIMEGVYLAGWVITQRRFELQGSETEKGSASRELTPAMFVGGLCLIIYKGFFPLDGFNQIAWFAFSPLVMYLLVPIHALLKRGYHAEKNYDPLQAHAQATRFVDTVMRVFLVVGDVIRQLFEAISTLLEREAGLIWAIIFLVLLLTLFKGLS
jgi:hypothetical protein